MRTKHWHWWYNINDCVAMLNHCWCADDVHDNDDDTQAESIGRGLCKCDASLYCTYNCLIKQHKVFSPASTSTIKFGLKRRFIHMRSQRVSTVSFEHTNIKLDKFEKHRIELFSLSFQIGPPTNLPTIPYPTYLRFTLIVFF